MAILPFFLYFLYYTSILNSLTKYFVLKLFCENKSLNNILFGDLLLLLDLTAQLSTLIVILNSHNHTQPPAPIEKSSIAQTQ